MRADVPHARVVWRSLSRRSAPGAEADVHELRKSSRNPASFSVSVALSAVRYSPSPAMYAANFGSSDSM
jgi:hypothetical protein